MDALYTIQQEISKTLEDFRIQILKNQILRQQDWEELMEKRSKRNQRLENLVLPSKSVWKPPDLCAKPSLKESLLLEEEFSELLKSRKMTRRGMNEQQSSLRLLQLNPVSVVEQIIDKATASSQNHVNSTLERKGSSGDTTNVAELTQKEFHPTEGNFPELPKFGQNGSKSIALHYDREKEEAETRSERDDVGVVLQEIYIHLIYIQLPTSLEVPTFITFAEQHKINGVFHYLRLTDSEYDVVNDMEGISVEMMVENEHCHTISNLVVIEMLKFKECEELSQIFDPGGFEMDNQKLSSVTVLVLLLHSILNLGIYEEEKLLPDFIVEISLHHVFSICVADLFQPQEDFVDHILATCSSVVLTKLLYGVKRLSSLHLNSDGDSVEAFGMMNQMYMIRLKRDTVILSIFVHNSCLEGEITDTHELLNFRNKNMSIKHAGSYNTVIVGYYKEERVLKVWNDMMNREIIPRLIMHNSVIRELCKLGKTDMDIAKMNELWENGLALDEDLITYITIIQWYCWEREIEIVSQFHNKGVERAFKHDIYPCNILLQDLWCKQRMLDKAIKFFKISASKEKNLDAVTYNTSVAGLPKEVGLEVALSSLTEMEGKELGPDIYAFNVLFLTFQNTGKTKEGGEFLFKVVEKDSPSQYLQQIDDWFVNGLDTSWKNNDELENVVPAFAYPIRAEKVVVTIQEFKGMNLEKTIPSGLESSKALMGWGDIGKLGKDDEYSDAELEVHEDGISSKWPVKDYLHRKVVVGGVWANNKGDLIKVVQTKVAVKPTPVEVYIALSVVVLYVFDPGESRRSQFCCFILSCVWKLRSLVESLFCWTKSDCTLENGYAQTVEGIHVLVNVQNMVVIKFEDRKLVPLPPADQLRNYTLCETRGGVDRSNVKPLQIVQAEGPSFCIRGHYVEWQKWNFCIVFTPMEGLVIHSVAYVDGNLGKKPIAHRMSFVEMVVPYGDPNDPHYKKFAFDAGEDGIEKNAHSLKKECDFLGYMKYYDALFTYFTGGVETIENCVCLHEEDHGILWKHQDWRTGHAKIKKSRRPLTPKISDGKAAEAFLDVEHRSKSLSSILHKMHKWEKTDNFESNAVIGERYYGRVYFTRLENGNKVTSRFANEWWSLIQSEGVDDVYNGVDENDSSTSAALISAPVDALLSAMTGQYNRSIISADQKPTVVEIVAKFQTKNIETKDEESWFSIYFSKVDPWGQGSKKEVGNVTTSTDYGGLPSGSWKVNEAGR